MLCSFIFGQNIQVHKELKFVLYKYAVFNLSYKEP